MAGDKIASMLGGLGVDMHGRGTILSLQLKSGGKFLWTPVSWTLDADGDEVELGEIDLHPDRCEAVAYLSGGVDLGVALPEPCPSAVGKMNMGVTLGQKVFIEGFEVVDSKTVFCFGGGTQGCLRIPGLEFDLFDVCLYFSPEDTVWELTGSVCDFGFSLPLTLADAGQWGIIPFEAKLAAKAQPTVKLKLYQEQVERLLAA
jgi:hypothetical protein